MHLYGTFGCRVFYQEGFMAPFLIAANWKMYKNLQQTREYFEAWNSQSFPTDREVLFLPACPLIHFVRTLLPEGQKLGAQICHEEDEGAFTGEVSCALLGSLGCDYVLIGHSERRHIFGEDDARLSAKFKASLRHGLRPIFCVGEKLHQRESGQTWAVIESQLSNGLGESPPASGFDLAYEPVWAIGTGKVASPDDAGTVHRSIRQWLSDHGVDARARILYGGSVKPSNAAPLLETPEVGGLLVGGASLSPESFSDILWAGLP